MDLKEGLLEDVFGHLDVAEVMAEIAVELLFVTPHQLFKSGPVAMIPVFQEELLVAPGGRRTSLCSETPLVFNYAAHF